MHAFNFRPQEGWVRARHSRRLEDLEQITKLQDQVRTLEAENAQLRRKQDPTDLLAQREDIMQWKFPLSRTSAGTDPPASEFTISATWDEILTTCFPGGLPLNSSNSVNEKLFEVLTVRLWRQYGDDANTWLDQADGNCFGDARLLEVEERGPIPTPRTRPHRCRIFERSRHRRNVDAHKQRQDPVRCRRRTTASTSDSVSPKTGLRFVAKERNPPLKNSC